VEIQASAPRTGIVNARREARSGPRVGIGNRYSRCAASSGWRVLPMRPAATTSSCITRPFTGRCRPARPYAPRFVRRRASARPRARHCPRLDLAVLSRSQGLPLRANRAAQDRPRGRVRPHLHAQHRLRHPRPPARPASCQQDRAVDGAGAARNPAAHQRIGKRYPLPGDQTPLWPCLVQRATTAMASPSASMVKARPLARARSPA
jgi:hypothetical protein